jgi:hypothetical protein
VADNGTNKPQNHLLTGRKGQAAALLAEDELTDAEVAQTVGVSLRQLYRWKADPDFAAAVKGLASQLGELARRYTIGRRARRVKALEERWQGLHKRLLQIQRVFQERAGHPDVAGQPGAETGLVVRTYKSIGSGAAARVIEEYPVDVALLREERDTMRALCDHELQAAKELGQWVDKVAPTTTEGDEAYGPRGFSNDEVIAILEQLAARLGFAPAGPPGEQPPQIG